MGQVCPKHTAYSCVVKMQHVEGMLREMICKYEKQHAEVTREVRLHLYNRPRALRLMRKRKILESHIASCENKLNVCMNKQCALEQLEITKLQVEALKQSNSVFQRFTRRNSLARIEELNETMQELSEDLMDMNELMSTPLQTVDEEEVLKDLSELEAELLPQVPLVATVSSVASESPVQGVKERTHAELELVVA